MKRALSVTYSAKALHCGAGLVGLCWLHSFLQTPVARAPEGGSQVFSCSFVWGKWVGGAPHFHRAGALPDR